MLNNNKIMLDFAKLCIALQKNLFKKARIMLNTSQIMLDFAKLCLALMLNAKRLKIMPKSIIMLNMATLVTGAVPSTPPPGPAPVLFPLFKIKYPEILSETFWNFTKYPEILQKCPSLLYQLYMMLRIPDFF